MNANRVTIAATTTVTTMRSLTTRSAGSALVTFIIVVLCSIAREGEEMERNDGRTRRPRGGWAPSQSEDKGERRLRSGFAYEGRIGGAHASSARAKEMKNEWLMASTARGRGISRRRDRERQNRRTRGGRLRFRLGTFARERARRGESFAQPRAPGHR